MDPKELKRLAAVCRKAGIKTFKSGDIEFTLADTPVKAPKAAKKADLPTGASEIDEKGWDSFTDDEKMFWSTPNPEVANRQ